MCLLIRLLLLLSGGILASRSLGLDFYWKIQCGLSLFLTKVQPSVHSDHFSFVCSHVLGFRLWALGRLCLARMLDSWLRLLLNQKAQVKGISFTDEGGRLVPQGVIQSTWEAIITIYCYFSNLVSSKTWLLGCGLLLLGYLYGLNGNMPMCLRVAFAFPPVWVTVMCIFKLPGDFVLHFWVHWGWLACIHN